MVRFSILVLSAIFLFGFSEPPERPGIDQIPTHDPLGEALALEQYLQELNDYREQRLLWKQEALAELGWYRGEVDGIYGPLTEEAVNGAIEHADLELESHSDLTWAIYEGEVPEAPAPLRYGVGEPWATLAECESGNWINGGQSFERGSARWNWGAPGMQLPPWGTTIHHGGLQHAPSTWSWVAPMVGLGHIQYAYQATPQQQVQVAQKVQELQGWRAWPVCSRLIGLR